MPREPNGPDPLPTPNVIEPENYVRESAPGWGIFPTLRTIVERVVDEFTDKVSPFDELLIVLKTEFKELKK